MSHRHRIQWIIVQSTTTMLSMMMILIVLTRIDVINTHMPIKLRMMMIRHARIIDVLITRLAKIILSRVMRL